MELNVTRRVIQQAIRRVLQEHVEAPFLLLREMGLQARLWSLLRQELEPDVVDSQVIAKSSRHQHTGQFKTARVQLELKVGSQERSDIVVLRPDKRPRLTCFPRGPTDVVAAIDPSDVEAVIEMKAGPSRGNGKAFVADVRKLDKLCANHPHIQCYFVLIDKSLPVPGANCDPGQSADETWPRLLGRDLQQTSGENIESFVEIWDLACDRGPKPAPRLRYWV